MRKDHPVHRLIWDTMNAANKLREDYESDSLPYKVLSNLMNELYGCDVEMIEYSKALEPDRLP